MRLVAIRPSQHQHRHNREAQVLAQSKTDVWASYHRSSSAQGSTTIAEGDLKMKRQ
jgi:hypothetical protein